MTGDSITWAGLSGEVRSRPGPRAGCPSSAAGRRYPGSASGRYALALYQDVGLTAGARFVTFVYIPWLMHTLAPDLVEIMKG